MWDSKDRISLFYDTNNKTITVAIKQLKEKDEGMYDCVFVTGTKPATHTFELEVHDDDGCHKAIHQPASTSAQTTIACNNPTDDWKATVKFFCKESSSDCGEIVSTTSPSNGSFTMTETGNMFNMIISATTSKHAGVYWCGVKSKVYRIGLKKIQLQVQEPPAASTSSMSPTRLTVTPSPVPTNIPPADKNGRKKCCFTPRSDKNISVSSTAR
ncbi:uncharacterized protein LOC117507730 [Thalassophryne amazonica]|uniref:uncharacterized protein LOC117507730 n=1 Tax=Thalassophryne amazonica TaxID=390379 RepID=UPI001470CD1D|nr:uncharacterized protein LOC117507730 [Thalassophryne amazonica]